MMRALLDAEGKIFVQHTLKSARDRIRQIQSQLPKIPDAKNVADLRSEAGQLEVLVVELVAAAEKEESRKIEEFWNS